MSILHPFDPKTWPFCATDLPPGGCLVGGAVRDGLLHRQKHHWDLDIILPIDVISCAEKLAKKYHVSLVILDSERQIARLIFPQITLDLCQRYGQDIATDLSQRDFTINAIAWDYQKNELYDPYKGQNDLQTKTIRMVHPDNLCRDPLRLLRAYRLGAQLDFKIETQTHQTIKKLAPLLVHVAPERVQNELHLLLENHRGSGQLIQAWNDGVLTPWFPDIKSHWIKLLPYWDNVFPFYPQLTSELQQELRPGRSVLNTLKLRSLLPEDRDLSERILTQLRYSRAEIQYMDRLITLWPVFQTLINQSVVTIPDQFHLFQQAGRVLPGLVAVAWVHDYPWPVVASWLERFSNPDDPVAHARPLVSGHDLMQKLQLSPGPPVGELLRLLALAHAQGQITTPRAALALAAELWSNR